MVKRLSILILLLGACCFSVSCNRGDQSAENVVPGSRGGKGDGTGPGRDGGQLLKRGGGVEITVFAAASTRNALDLMTEVFQRIYDVKFNINYASTGQLANQIIQGAPADIFFSANNEWLEKVEAEGLVREKLNLIGNELVLVVPTGNPAGVKSIQDLEKKAVTRIAIADVMSVPAGIYAKQSLEKSQLWEKVSPKIVSGADVRVTLAYVERGEAEAGIVYLSDSKITKEAEVVATIDPSTHDPIEYPVALLVRADENGMARKFFKFFESHFTEKIFRTQGFATRHNMNNSVATNQKEMGNARQRVGAKS